MGKELKVAKDAALTAGKILLSYFGKTTETIKEDNSIVTEADHASEKKIKKIIHKAFPTHSFIGEESGEDIKDTEYVWVVDPLDGTSNFQRMNPFFNVSIALAKNEVPIIGVVYYPIMKELFCAEKGKGSYLNGKRIHVSKVRDLHRAFMQFCHGSNKRDIEKVLKVYRQLKLNQMHIRQVGAAALELCFVACARSEVFFMPGSNSWDVAAGQLIVSEAGGRSTDIEGRPYNITSKSLISSNKMIHNKMIGLLK